MNTQQPSAAPVKKVLVKRVKVLVKRPVAAPPQAVPVQSQKAPLPYQQGANPSVQRPAPSIPPAAQRTPAPAAQRAPAPAVQRAPAPAVQRAPAPAAEPRRREEAVNQRTPIAYKLPRDIPAALRDCSLAEKILALYIYIYTYARQVSEKTGHPLPKLLVKMPQYTDQVASFVEGINKKFFEAVLHDFAGLAPFVKGMERIVRASGPWDQVARAEAKRVRGTRLTTADKLTFAYLDLMIDIDIYKKKIELKEIKNKARQIINSVKNTEKQIAALKKRFVAAIERKRFPVDAKKLVDNYFTLAQKDAEQAYKTLITNPLYFSPIQLERMPKKFFGMSKPSAQDAMDVNKQLAAFLKKLKA